MTHQHCCPMQFETLFLATERIPQIAALARALADETRLRLLLLLVRQEQPVCVCHLAEHMPVGQPTVSHHLSILRQVDLVTVERRGPWAYYQATPLARAVLDALKQVLTERVTT